MGSKETPAGAVDRYRLRVSLRRLRQRQSRPSRLVSTYNSPLRAEQKERTHERILEAAAEQLLEKGLEELSLPRAARRARVSVPTVYRHFPTQEALMRELTEWVGRRTNIDQVPANVDEFTGWVPRLFAH